MADFLLTVGRRARWIAAEALDSGLRAGNVKAVDTIAEAIAVLRAAIGPGDVVLIKGSRAAHMDDLVMALAWSSDRGLQEA